jgi:hypothetical protein
MHYASSTARSEPWRPRGPGGSGSARGVARAKSRSGFVTVLPRATRLPRACPPDQVRWLLVQHLETDVAGFYAAHTTQKKRAVTMGRAPALMRPPGQPDVLKKALLPPGSAGHGQKGAHDALNGDHEVKGHGHKAHVTALKSTLLRRGFPFRRDRKEGLMFVAGTASIAAAKNAVDGFFAAANPDPLLPHVSAQASAVFYCPPDGTWSGSQQPLTLSDHAITAQGPSDLVAYEVGAEFLEYMERARASAKLFQGTQYGDLGPQAPIEALLAQIDAALGAPGFNAANFKALRDELQRVSNLIDGWLDEYHTLA